MKNVRENGNVSNNVHIELTLYLGSIWLALVLLKHLKARGTVTIADLGAKSRMVDKVGNGYKQLAVLYVKIGLKVRINTVTIIVTLACEKISFKKGCVLERSTCFVQVMLR